VIPGVGDPQETSKLDTKLGFDVLLQSQRSSSFNQLLQVFPNCYWLAAGGTQYNHPPNTPYGWQFSNYSAPWIHLKQGDLSALAEFEGKCIGEFYSKQGVDKLIKSKIDEVKAQYVDKIGELSPEVLAAIKTDVVQRVEADLLPKLLEEVKREVAKQKPPAVTPQTAPKQPSRVAGPQDH
jgi:hypothetical protein